MLRRYPKTRKPRSTPPRVAASTPRRAYDTDLTEAQWRLIEPLLSAKQSEVDRREILNALFYLLRAGGSWRLLPHDFPPWQTVYDYDRLWQRDGTIERVHATLREQVRVAAGRDAQPTAGSIDSQSVKTTEQGGVKGFDAGKKIKGRKRHILVDTIGLVVAVVVHSADIQDHEGARPVFARAYPSCPRLERIWADSAYDRCGLAAWALSQYDWSLEVVKREKGLKGFHVIPHRWVVERTFAWLGRYRRLSKDYERLTTTSEAMIQTAMIHVMVRRLEPGSQAA